MRHQVLLGFPFDLNQSLTFPGLSQLNEVCTYLGHLCFDMSIFFELFVGRHRRCRLVNEVEGQARSHQMSTRDHREGVPS